MEGRNKRERSFYKLEGRNGFIFRDPSRVDMDADQQVMVDGCGHVTEVIGQSGTPAAVNLSGSDNESLQGIWRRLEVERFLGQLKKELLACGSTQAGDECWQELKEELGRGDLYFNYMESQEFTDDELRTAVAEGGIDSLTENISMYKRELGEWDEALDKRKALVDRARRGYSEERQLDYLSLQSKDTDALKSFLSAEQLSLLDVDHCGTPSFVPDISNQLDVLNGLLDAELTRLATVASMKTSKGSSLDMSVVDETPKTLFKALKDVHS